MSASIFDICGIWMCTIKLNGIIDAPNMGKHTKDRQYKKIKIIVTSMFRDEDYSMLILGEKYQAVEHLNHKILEDHCIFDMDGT